MAYKSITDGIIFIEGTHNYIQLLGPVKYTNDLFNSQLKNLLNVKNQMANRARSMGANAIIDFKYGQRSKGFFTAFLLNRDDNIDWYGEGTAVILDQSEYNDLVAKINSQ